MSDIEIEIDGKPLKVKPNSMIIQVADEAGIYIPRFCYHKHLSIAANCRMCLVEVEKAPKPAPACATPVMPGMKVFTRSAKALAAQRAVMEFLLVNHPLDCPICDQGGECELQDLSMGYGNADSYYTFGKRSVEDKDLGPLISSDMTRCIQCTRCVRFGDEIAGLRELGATGRGENMEIGTYVQKAMQSNVSGNVIDVCPVGALTSKPYRFTARAWELKQSPSIAAHDCVGSNIHVHTQQGKVKRVVPREQDDINQTWISDRDRYSYQGLYHAERIEKPMIRIHGQWKETDWQTALETASKSIHEVIRKHGPDQFAAMISPNATTEEGYLLQKIMQAVGSPNIDHRLRQVDFKDDHMMQHYAGSTASIADIQASDVIVLMGSNIANEQPILGLRVRQAARQGAKIIAINMVDYAFNFNVAQRKIIAPHQFVSTLASIAKALIADAPFDVNISEQDQQIAEILRQGKKVTVLIGALSLNHPDAATIKQLAYMMTQACQGELVLLTEGANAAGAYQVKAIPHQNGMNAAEMIAKPRKGYLLLNVEPEYDCANPAAAVTALEQADCVVALSLFKNESLEKIAHVILPMAAFTETAGTYVNLTGQWQTFQGVANPVGEARPAWKILRVLANFLHLDNFEYQSADDVLTELKQTLNTEKSPLAFEKPVIQSTSSHGLSRIGEVPIYAGDSLVRRAKALQETQTIIEGDVTIARMHPKTAERLNIKEHDIVRVKQSQQSISLAVKLDKRIAEDSVWIAGAITATQGLSSLMGDIQLECVGK